MERVECKKARCQGRAGCVVDMDSEEVEGEGEGEGEGRGGEETVCCISFRHL